MIYKLKIFKILYFLIRNFDKKENKVPSFNKIKGDPFMPRESSFSLFKILIEIKPKLGWNNHFKFENFIFSLSLKINY